MDTELTIGQAIRKARGKVTLKDLAERTGYSLTYLSDVQRDRTTPSLKALMAIAKALDVTPGMILDAVSDPGIFDRETFARRIMAIYDAAADPLSPAVGRSPVADILQQETKRMIERQAERIEEQLAAIPDDERQWYTVVSERGEPLRLEKKEQL